MNLGNATDVQPAFTLHTLQNHGEVFYSRAHWPLIIEEMADGQVKLFMHSFQEIDEEHLGTNLHGMSLKNELDYPIMLCALVIFR